MMQQSSKPTSRIVKLRRGGRVTIPAEFRKRLGINEDSLIRMTLEGDELVLRKLEASGASQGSPWLKDLYDLFEPVRKDLESRSETEVDAAIDQAVKEARDGPSD